MPVEKLIEFLDAYNLPWFLLAVVTWLVIYITCSLQQFFHALPVALWTMATGGILERFFIEHKFWSEEFIMIHIGGLDLFVIIGPFFSLGLVFIRFLPKGRWKKYFSALAFAALSTGIELIATKLGFLQYHGEKWNGLHSFVAYSLGLMSALGFYYVYYNKDLSNQTYR